MKVRTVSSTEQKAERRSGAPLIVRTIALTPTDLLGRWKTRGNGKAEQMREQERGEGAGVKRPRAGVEPLSLLLSYGLNRAQGICQYMKETKYR